MGERESIKHIHGEHVRARAGGALLRGSLGWGRGLLGGGSWGRFGGLLRGLLALLLLLLDFLRLGGEKEEKIIVAAMVEVCRTYHVVGGWDRLSVHTTKTEQTWTSRRRREPTTECLLDETSTIAFVDIVASTFRSLSRSLVASSRWAGTRDDVDVGICLSGTNERC